MYVLHSLLPCVFVCSKEACHDKRILWQYERQEHSRINNVVLSSKINRSVAVVIKPEEVVFLGQNSSVVRPRWAHACCPLPSPVPLQTPSAHQHRWWFQPQLWCDSAAETTIRTNGDVASGWRYPSLHHHQKLSTQVISSINTHSSLWYSAKSVSSKTDWTESARPKILWEVDEPSVMSVISRQSWRTSTTVFRQKQCRLSWPCYVSVASPCAPLWTVRCSLQNWLLILKRLQTDR